MATVRMSRSLVWDIEKNAKKKFDLVNAEKEFPIADTWFNTNIRPKIENATEKMEEIFDGSLSLSIDQEVEKLYINTVFPSTNQGDNLEESDRKETYQLRFTSEQTIPKFMTSNWNTINLDLNFQDPFVKELEQIRSFNSEISKARHAYKNRVIDTVEEFTTLNQALKAWPALKDLVPQEKIAKVHEKVQRKAKQQQQREAIEVQEQELNEVILTANLLES